MDFFDQLSQRLLGPPSLVPLLSSFFETGLGGDQESISPAPQTVVRELEQEALVADPGPLSRYTLAALLRAKIDWDEVLPLIFSPEFFPEEALESNQWPETDEKTSPAPIVFLPFLLNPQPAVTLSLLTPENREQSTHNPPRATPLPTEETIREAATNNSKEEVKKSTSNEETAIKDKAPAPVVEQPREPYSEDPYDSPSLSVASGRDGNGEAPLDHPEGAPGAHFANPNKDNPPEEATPSESKEPTIRQAEQNDPTTTRADASQEQPRRELANVLEALASPAQLLAETEVEAPTEANPVDSNHLTSYQQASTDSEEQRPASEKSPPALLKRERLATQESEAPTRQDFESSLLELRPLSSMILAEPESMSLPETPPGAREQTPSATTLSPERESSEVLAPRHNVSRQQESAQTAHNNKNQPPTLSTAPAEQRAEAPQNPAFVLAREEGSLAPQETKTEEAPGVATQPNDTTDLDRPAARLDQHHPNAAKTPQALQPRAHQSAEAPKKEAELTLSPVAINTQRTISEPALHLPEEQPEQITKMASLKREKNAPSPALSPPPMQEESAANSSAGEPLASSPERRRGAQEAQRFSSIDPRPSLLEAERSHSDSPPYQQEELLRSESLLAQKMAHPEPLFVTAKPSLDAEPSEEEIFTDGTNKTKRRSWVDYVDDSRAPDTHRFVTPFQLISEAIPARWVSAFTGQPLFTKSFTLEDVSSASTRVEISSAEVSAPTLQDIAPSPESIGAETEPPQPYSAEQRGERKGEAPERSRVLVSRAPNRDKPEDIPEETTLAPSQETTGSPKQEAPSTQTSETKGVWRKSAPAESKERHQQETSRFGATETSKTSPPPLQGMTANESTQNRGPQSPPKPAQGVEESPTTQPPSERNQIVIQQEQPRLEKKEYSALLAVHQRIFEDKTEDSPQHHTELSPLAVALPVQQTHAYESIQSQTENRVFTREPNRPETTAQRQSVAINLTEKTNDTLSHGSTQKERIEEAPLKDSSQRPNKPRPTTETSKTPHLTPQDKPARLTPARGSNGEPASRRRRRSSFIILRFGVELDGGSIGTLHHRAFPDGPTADGLPYQRRLGQARRRRDFFNRVREEAPATQHTERESPPELLQSSPGLSKSIKEKPSSIKADSPNSEPQQLEAFVAQDEALLGVDEAPSWKAKRTEELSPHNPRSVVQMSAMLALLSRERELYTREQRRAALEVSSPSTDHQSAPPRDVLAPLLPGRARLQGLEERERGLPQQTSAEPKRTREKKNRPSNLLASPRGETRLTTQKSATSSLRLTFFPESAATQASTRELFAALFEIKARGFTTKNLGEILFIGSRRQRAPVMTARGELVLLPEFSQRIKEKHHQDRIIAEYFSPMSAPTAHPKQNITSEVLTPASSTEAGVALASRVEDARDEAQIKERQRPRPDEQEAREAAGLPANHQTTAARPIQGRSVVVLPMQRTEGGPQPESPVQAHHESPKQEAIETSSQESPNKQAHAVYAVSSPLSSEDGEGVLDTKVIARLEETRAAGLASAPVQRIAAEIQANPTQESNPMTPVPHQASSVILRFGVELDGGSIGMPHHRAFPDGPTADGLPYQRRFGQDERRRDFFDGAPAESNAEQGRETKNDWFWVAGVGADNVAPGLSTVTKVAERATTDHRESASPSRKAIEVVYSPAPSASNKHNTAPDLHQKSPTGWDSAGPERHTTDAPTAISPKETITHLTSQESQAEVLQAQMISLAPSLVGFTFEAPTTMKQEPRNSLLTMPSVDLLQVAPSLFFSEPSHASIKRRSKEEPRETSPGRSTGGVRKTVTAAPQTTANANGAEPMGESIESSKPSKIERAPAPSLAPAKSFALEAPSQSAPGRSPGLTSAHKTRPEMESSSRSPSLIKGIAPSPDTAPASPSRVALVSLAQPGASSGGVAYREADGSRSAASLPIQASEETTELLEHPAAASSLAAFVVKSSLGREDTSQAAKPAIRRATTRGATAALYLKRALARTTRDQELHDKTASPPSAVARPAAPKERLLRELHHAEISPALPAEHPETDNERRGARPARAQAAEPAPLEREARASLRGNPEPSLKIRVHIGRIEIKTTAPLLHKTKEVAEQRTTSLSLDEYLSMRDKGSHE